MDEEEIPRFKLVEEVALAGWVFEVSWEYDRFRAEFTICRAGALFEDGSPSGDWEEELRGHVDWGGCFHLNADQYVHLCSVSMLEQHCAILRYVYDRGRSLADA